jgi:hypothetical protein
MSDPELDHAARLLRATGRIAMTVSELAAALHPATRAAGRRAHDGPATHDGTEPDGATAAFEGRLRQDGRFVVVAVAGNLPGTEIWTAADRAAYAHVLGRLGLPGPRLVLLRDAAGADAPSPIHRLLHHTVVGLMALPSAPMFAAAAEAARAALEPIRPGPP